MKEKNSIDIKKVAEVARLNLSEEEIKKFSKDLENILEAFKELEKVNTESVEPTFQPIEVKDVLREDKIEDSFGQEKALSQIKTNKEEGHFKGPKAV